jgi:hypothetical protein
MMTCSGILLACIALLYKSKCSHVRCCGFLDIERNTQAEEQIDEIELEQKNNNA